ncbi:hypothetical protein [Nonomuraea typhae]|uniref:hypothetical protein n=1 Tax=Nonomuraea typhae TaxID=2603600 RepID=UPI0012FB029D|nr:hypothetical protein [Nonomuraea typhae]
MTTPPNPSQGEEPDARESQWSPPPQQPGPAPPYDQPYGQPYGQAPHGQSPYGEPPKSSGTQVMSIIAFVCAGVALLILPIIFGPIGIVLGIVGHTRGESLGKWSAVTAGVTMVLSMVIGFLVLQSRVA